MQIEKIKKPVDYFLASFSIVIMVLLVVCVTWQVFSRYVLSIPSTVTDEIARFSMIWVVLLGAAYTVGLQKHLAIDLMIHNFKGRKKYISGLFINLCVIAFALGAMVYGGSVLVAKVYASGQISPSMQIPMAYIYLALPLSGLLMTFYCGLFVSENLINLVHNKED